MDEVEGRTAGEVPADPAAPQAPTQPAPPSPADPAAEDRPLAQASAHPGLTEGQREGAEVRPVESATDEVPSEEERAPAYDQAPVAHEAQDAIIGDPGLRGEQQPLQSEGTPTNVNQPVRTSAPPPSAQSGVPLAEDRAAGIEPGAKGPAVPVREGEGELPEHDASEGQSTTPPHGG